jgi:ribosomal protein L21E
MKTLYSTPSEDSTESNSSNDVRLNENNYTLLRELLTQVAQQTKAIESLTTTIQELQISCNGTRSHNKISSLHSDADSSKKQKKTGKQCDNNYTKPKPDNNSTSYIISKNNDGYCEGDEVEILFDRAGNYFNPKHRKTPTDYEGKRGFVTHTTACFVTVLLGGVAKIKKANHNIRLIKPNEGSENIQLPNGMRRTRKAVQNTICS